MSQEQRHLSKGCANITPEMGCRLLAISVIQQAKRDYNCDDAKPSQSGATATNYNKKDAEDFFFTDRLDNFIETFGLSDKLSPRFIRSRIGFRDCNKRNILNVSS